jgi:hypothetical protein
MWAGPPTQRPVNATGLEPCLSASLFHSIPRRSSDRRRPPVIHLSRLPRVRSSSARKTGRSVAQLPNVFAMQSDCHKRIS